MFGFGFANRRTMEAGVVPPFNPATVNLPGWWKADDYDDGPVPNIPGTASAGASGVQPLVDTLFAGLYKPVLGTGLNGHDFLDLTANYFHWLDTGALVGTDFFDADKVTNLIFGQVIDSDTNDPIPYNNRGMFGLYGGFGGWTVRNDAGQLYAQAWIFDTGANSNVIEFPVNAGDNHFFQMSLYGGNLHARIDRGAWQTVPSLNVASLASYLSLASGGGGSAKSKIQEIFVARGFTEALIEDFADYIEAIYGVVLP